MRLLFDDLFSPTELTKKTRQYYSSYLNSSDLDADFKELFGISYKLIFGNMSKNESLFILLQKYYRNECFVKHAFQNQYPDISFLSECPITNKRADLIGYSNMQNNLSLTCYEIKTKYDNLNRLQSQIMTYAGCFNNTYVICSDDKMQAVIDTIPNYVGVICYKDRCNCVFKTIRRSKQSPVVNKSQIIDCLSSKELRRQFKTTDKKTVCESKSAKELQAALSVALTRSNTSFQNS